MLIELPQKIVEEILSAHHLQQWSIKSTEIRSRQVERLEAHISEIVCAIVVKEYIKKPKQLKLK